MMIDGDDNDHIIMITLTSIYRMLLFQLFLYLTCSSFLILDMES